MQKGTTAVDQSSQKAESNTQDTTKELISKSDALQKPQRKRKRGKASTEGLPQDEQSRRERQRELQKQAWSAQKDGKKYKKGRTLPAKQANARKETTQRQPPDKPPDKDFPQVQVIIIPIYWRKREQEAKAVVAAAEHAKQLLDQQGITCSIDANDALTPGQKYRLWEGRKVKARVEIGPKDAAAGKCVVAEAAATPGELATKKPCKIGAGMIATVQRGDFQGLQFDSAEEDIPGKSKKKRVKKILTEQGSSHAALPVKASTAQTTKPAKVVAF
ncbi:hypothetical protein WJX73_010114 [Symbiochloris irregularis]|uniref:Anticodon-binding domain-containing protein n=1 Tax=Symbiochloris irregularis TaxID=706552 RepID=A0AAW1NRY6_9CHLO